MAVPIEVLITVGSLIGAGSSAWGGAKMALNGTRKRVQEIVEAQVLANAKMDTHIANDSAVQLELATQGARTEAKVDILLARVK